MVHCCAVMKMILGGRGKSWKIFMEKVCEPCEWRYDDCWLLVSAGWDEASALNADGRAGEEDVTAADGGRRTVESTGNVVCHRDLTWWDFLNRITRFYYYYENVYRTKVHRKKWKIKTHMKWLSWVYLVHVNSIIKSMSSPLKQSRLT